MINIEAKDYDDAIKTIELGEYDYEILNEFIKHDFRDIIIAYGSNKPFSYKGSDDWEFIEEGTFELSLDDWIPNYEFLSVGQKDFIMFLLEELKSNSKDIEHLKNNLRNCRENLRKLESKENR